MIFGIGVDIAKCSRFEKWLDSQVGSKGGGMIERFFNPAEILDGGRSQAQDGASENRTQAQKSAALQHYAARFAAKEAFSKALGCGLAFDLRDAWIQNDADGKPELRLQKSAEEALKKRCPQWQAAKILVSLSHEKEYAVAQVAIEIP